MLNHIGTHPIETERLILRKVKLSDAEQIFENWAKDHENVKYFSWDAHKNSDETKKIISKQISEYSNLNYYRWIITLKENDDAIGRINVSDIIEDSECCEVTYILSKKFWNRGFMTEALHAVLDYLFNKVGFHRIQMYHDVDNLSSGRVMQKNDHVLK